MTASTQESAMGTRKTSPRNKTGRTRPDRAALNRAMWSDPMKAAALKAAIAEGRAKRPKAELTRLGVPDGMRKREAIALWAKAEEQGRKFIGLMERTGLVDANPLPGSEEEMAKSALQEAYVYAVSPMSDKKTKAAYIRIVLDWTRAKPESRSKLTLDKSGAWLKEFEADWRSTAS